MAVSLDELRDAIVRKLAQLLRDDEAGWYNAARWIDKPDMPQDLIGSFHSIMNQSR